MTQLKHEGSEWSTKLGQEITIVRGDDNYYTFTHGSLASEIDYIKLTARIKSSTEPGTGTAAIEIDSDAHSSQWDVATDYEGVVTFLDGDTNGFRKANSELDLDYDIQVVLNDADVYTVEKGTLRVEPDVTHDDSTAAYLTRNTRSDYDNELDAILAGMNSTVITTAGAASDTDLDVADTSQFTVGDEIGIVLDSGYQEVTLDSKTATNIDFSTSDPGGLTGAASVDNIVFWVS